MPKTILITGASSGIGKATVKYFQQKGWQVAATMRHPGKEKELAALENVKCFQLDVLDNKIITEAVNNVLTAFGKIDVLLNNAGYAEVGPLEAATEEDLRKQFDTNVFGVVRMMQAVLPHFRERKKGTIINVSSMGGRLTFPLYSLYHGTKWALEGISESLQYELKAFNIKVKIIEPGAIKTDFYNRSMNLMTKEGLNAYDDYTNRIFPAMQQFGNKAPGPEVVAKQIFKAANSSSSRLRYPIGSGAPLLLGLRKFLPGRLFNKIIGKAIDKVPKQ